MRHKLIMVLVGVSCIFLGVSELRARMPVAPGLPPVPAARPDDAGGVAFRQVGKASWYGHKFHGRKTASGQRFDQNKLTAAHRKLPLGTRIKVTNLENGKSVRVEVTDRGPYKRGRVLDLSKAAAHRLGMIEGGVILVSIEAS